MGLIKLFKKIIHKIERLFNRISILLVHKRMNAYHADENYSTKINAKDIRSPLLDYIDSISTDHEIPERTVEFGSFIPESPKSNKYQYEKHRDEKPHIINRQHIGDLSKYFKARRKAYTPNPGIEDVLKHSAWEHIYASIQCAHKGDKQNAKMHVDIASSACKELAHHMSEDLYAQFMVSINEKLGALTSSNK